MKKVIFAAFAALIVVPAMALAQGGPPPGAPHQGGPGSMGGHGGPPNMQMFQKMREQRQKDLRAKLVKELKMTPAQTKAYDALIKKENDGMAKMFKPGQRPDRTVFDKMRKAHEDAVKKIFTKDQFAKYTKIMEDERKNRRMGGGPGMGGHRPGTPPSGPGH